jgi:hypothetical protein
MNLNRAQKAFGIAELLDNPEFLNSFLLSSVVISHWISELEKKGILESPTFLSGFGENIYVVCSEFDWQVEDNEIKRYCEINMEGNTPEENEKFFTILKATMMEQSTKI